MTKLTKAAERIAAEAVSAALAGGKIVIVDGKGETLAHTEMADRGVYDPEAHVVRFAAPKKATVEATGDPAGYVVLSKTGEAILNGTAGEARRDPRENPDMVLAKRLFPGMKIALGEIEYAMKFTTEASA